MNKSPGLFGEDGWTDQREQGAVVKTIVVERTTDQPPRYRIKVGRRTLATLREKTWCELAIEAGAVVTQELADRIAEAATFEQAVEQAMKWINRKALFTAEVERKLQAIPLSALLVARVSAHLTQIGALDDARWAHALVDELRQHRQAGPQLIEQKLRQRGVPESMIESLLSQAADTDHADSAQAHLQQQALAQLQRWRELPRATQQRRLASWLMRKGYEADQVEQWVERWVPES